MKLQLHNNELHQLKEHETFRTSVLGIAPSQDGWISCLPDKAGKNVGNHPDYANQEAF